LTKAQGGKNIVDSTAQVVLPTRFQQALRKRLSSKREKMDEQKGEKKAPKNPTPIFAQREQGLVGSAARAAGCR